MAMIETTTGLEQWELALERLLESRGADAEAVKTLRRDAFAHFAANGFPTVRDEEWRLTSVQPIAAGTWSLAGPVPVDGDAIDDLRVEEAGLELVFVNGVHVESLSRGGDGVTARPLAELFERPGVMLEAYGRIALPQRSAFTALSTALATDGAAIEVGAGVRAGTIHVIHYASGEAIAVAPRVLVRAGRGAEATVIETHAGRGRYLTMPVTEIDAGEGAVIDHAKLVLDGPEAFHVGAVAATQARDAALHTRLIGAGAALARNDVSVLLDGEGATSALDGLYLLEGKQHFDAHTRIDHAKPHTESLELYKGVLDGVSRGVFNGLIIVRPDAQKIASRQTNKNLLLSNEAIADSNPQLEIHADDVKCNHGSTIGQIDPTALFYLRSRGIGIDEARAMLTHAFASEVVERIRTASLRARLERILLSRLSRKESR